MTETEIWTIGRLLSWTTDYLKKSGTSQPRLDAEVLLAQANGCRRIDLYVACIKLGVIFVPINILYRDREITHILNDARPALTTEGQWYRALSPA